MIALIMMIAQEMGVPPYFALSIAILESNLDPCAVSPVNQNGTVDYGIFQLNSQYFYDFDWSCPETNIRTGIRHIKWLIDHPWTCTYWSVAAAYNAGINRLDDLPDTTPDYANRVMRLWSELSGGNEMALIGGRQ